MTINTEIQILKKIKKAKRGTLFFTESFLTIGNADTLRKALERLVKDGKIQRVAPGIYVRPEMDPVIGAVAPGIDDIAKAIAKRDKARIVPTGIYALNKLGLSTQVPLNIIYLTDGAARKVVIDNRTITFKKVAPKNLSAVGEISRLVILALRTIGKDRITEDEIKKFQQLLKKEKKTKLEHDLRLAPAWIREIILPILKKTE
jgi:predicted transcriptional regulator of viral defense system